MSVRVYYNDVSKDCCAWLRELMKAGLIAEGEIDSRSITDVRPEDLKGFTRCHFFSGIAGWEYALQLAGWPDDRVVWTGSAPCQSFSSAGKEKGVEDHRDLWPDFRRLIAESRPAILFGEQVERAVTHGWLDRLCNDLEAEDYAVGAHVLPACSAGAFHVRSRIYWVGAGDSFTHTPALRRERWWMREGSWAADEFTRLVQEALRLSVPAGKRGAVCDGVPSRMVQLCGYGNAIYPPLAAEFIRAYLDCEVSA